MTLQELCKKYNIAESTVVNAFPRTQKSIYKKYNVRINKIGRGKNASYEEEPREESRALTMYEESKDKMVLDHASFHLILMLLLFYLFRNSSRGWIGILLGMIWINGFLMAGQDIPFTLMGHEFFFPQQAFAIFALIPIWMYNGKLGPHNKKIQLAAYSFYPAHMLIITVISKIFA